MTIDNVIELDKILFEDASVIEGHDILSSPKKFLFIIEGNDDYVFYKACVQRQGLNETHFEFVICNGKANVLKNLHRKQEFFKLSQIILFFIDKDFDDYWYYFLWS